MGNIKLSIPEGWNEITTKQYSDLLQIGLNSDIINQLMESFNEKETVEFRLGNMLMIDTKEFKSLIQALCIIFNKDEQIIRNIACSELKNIVKELLWLKPISEVEEHKLEYNIFKVGHWINCELVIDKGVEKNFLELANAIFDKDVSNEPITKTYNIIMEFLYYRKDLFGKFPNLFPNKENQDEIKSNEELQKERFYKVYTWHEYLLNLAGGDVLKMEAASELNFVFSLNHLNYLHNKEKLIPLKDKF